MAPLRLTSLWLLTPPRAWALEVLASTSTHPLIDALEVDEVRVPWIGDWAVAGLGELGLLGALAAAAAEAAASGLGLGRVIALGAALQAAALPWTEVLPTSTAMPTTSLRDVARDTRDL